MRLMERTVGIGAHASASYFIVRYGAQAASHAADFASYVGPKIAYCFSILGSLGTSNNQSLISISISWPKVFSNLGTKVVDYGHHFDAFANLPPLHGVVAGFGISLIAQATDFALEKTRLKTWTFTRCLLSHAVAGALVWGFSATALKVGLVAVALTGAGAITLTTTALAVHLIMRLVFSCIGSKPIEHKPNEQKPNEQKPNEPNPKPLKSPSKVDGNLPSEQESLDRLPYEDDSAYRKRFLPLDDN